MITILMLTAETGAAVAVVVEAVALKILNTFKSAEHSRFDASHELGHLVRDSHSMLHGKAHSPEMEREANAYWRDWLDVCCPNYA